MNKVLVAYFSATGTTEAIAKKLAHAIGADTFKISPAVPYTKADLNWQDKTSRSSIETADKKSRPKIDGKVQNIDQYDTIFVGFPIWWYVAPHIINTFLEQYDLTGKKIIPFATSGSSGMGRTNDALKVSAPGAVLLEGKRFARSASESEIREWAEKLV
ncbi:MAG TPA: flavodoxin [Lachnospiraceae bacterium]|nr:flavodoxin [Lachnospiraceae bacterium]